MSNDPAETQAEAPFETTSDAFFRGAFHLIQPKTGFRAGFDALALAACVPPDRTGRAADLGAGSGVVALAAAVRCPWLAVTLVESDARMAALARSNLALPGNAGLAARLGVVETDLLGGRAARAAAGLVDGAFETVLTNPPFHPAGGRASPDPTRHAARAMPDADFLRRWLMAASALLATGGLLLLVARPDNIEAVLGAAENRYGDIRVRPVHPRPERRASRILVSARRGSKAPFQLLPAIVLHDGAGRPTPIGQAIADGRATIDFAI